MVNSGRLSVPCHYDGLSLNGVDALDGPANVASGAACVDAPLNDGFLLERLDGQFTVMAIDAAKPDIDTVDGVAIKSLELATATDDPSGALRARYLGEAPSGVYLIRPDQHVVARWSVANHTDIEMALRTALGKGH